MEAMRQRVLELFLQRQEIQFSRCVQIEAIECLLVLFRLNCARSSCIIGSVLWHDAFSCPLASHR